MSSMRTMTEDRERSRALVVQHPQPSGSLTTVRRSDLAVIPPRPIPLSFRARRSFARFTKYGILAAIAGLCGYAYRDAGVRSAVDYRLTMLTAPGVTAVSPSAASNAASPEPLPAYASHLFAGNQKGPRADKLAYAMKSGFGRNIVTRRTKTNPLHIRPQPAAQLAALAGAGLFLSAFNPQEPLLEGASAPPRRPGGNWAGLLKNASLSPEQPQTLFGGLTEDEFRKRELRCMATAIYFEARDEPVRGQVAVGQVIMNRIRSPFYPKTICGVVYQGERNRHGCQFSFTCTGKHRSIKEKPEWRTSVKLAKQVIAGQVWINEVGYATHYHATYVHPNWRHELIRVARIGGHIFYKMKPGTVRIALLSEGL